MPTVYLHSGGHKTGTSAFQSFIRDHRDWLAGHGLHVPAIGQVPDGAHHILVRALAGLAAIPRHAVIPDQLHRHIVEQGFPNLLISSENLGPLLERQTLRERIQTFFASLNYKIVVILFIRHSPPSINARYSQMAKMLNESDPIDVFVEGWLAQKRDPAILWRRLTPSTGLTAVFRPYNADVTRKGIVNALLAELGLPEHPAPLQSVNVSPSLEQIVLARWMARSMAQSGDTPTHASRQRIARAIADLVASRGSGRPAYVGLNTNLARKVEAAIEARVEEMAQAAWSMSWSEAFPNEVGRAWTSNDPEVCGAGTVAAADLADLQRAAWDRWTAIKAEAGNAVAAAQPPSLRAALDAFDEEHGPPPTD